MKTSTPLRNSLSVLKAISLKKTSHCLKIVIAIFLLNLTSVFKTNAQDNSGKEFWFTLFAETYLDHLPGIYIVSYYDCTVTIDYAARNPALDPAGDPECTRHTVNVIGGVPLYVDIPYDLQALCWRYADDLTVPETVQQNGIRVTSTAPIALYSQFLAQASSEMTPILPIEEMGTEYIATAYREITDIANEFNARASVTAIENGTVVTFTLPSNTWTSSTNINGGFSHGPGSTWSVTLNRGQTYTVLSNDNGQALTTTPAGSSVTVNNNQGLNGMKISSNKIISVMGGTDCTWVGNDEYPGCGACDLTSTHLKPVSEWKTRYISTQTLQRPNQMSLAVGLAAPPTPNIEPYPAGFNNMSVADYLLITAKDNATTVNITGQATYTKTLNAGQWFIYESPGNSNPTTPPPGTNPGKSNHVIQSNNPIQVIQMMKGWQCDNNNPADPTQMLVIEESMWRDNYIVTNPTQYVNNFFVFIIKEPLGTNVARNSLNLNVNGVNIPIPTGNSPTNDGTLGWSRMGTVEPYYYQRVNIAAGGAIKVKSVPLTAGGTKYPFAFYASGSTNASSYGYMGGAVCNLKAFAHADTANICLGTPTNLKLDSTQNGGSIAGITLYTYTWTVMNGATTVFTVSGTAASPNQTFTAPAAGIYTGYLDIADNAGCTARDTFNIYVNATIPAPTVPASITVCQGQNINLTASSTITGVTYAWTGPAPFTSTSQNPVITNATTANSGNYSVTVSKNGCTSLPATINVIVNPNAVITLTSAAGTNNQTVCANTAITPITYSITGGGTGATVTGLPAGVTGTYSGGAFTINGTPSVTNGTFNYTVTTTGNCTQASATGSIIINPNATITLTSAIGSNTQTVCINNAITPITYSVTGGGTGATVTGLPTGVTGSFAGGTFTINGTPSVAGTFNYTVTTSGTCVQATATGTITVNPNAAITLTSAAGTNTQTRCINTAITTITYSITGGGTGATVTGLPAGVTGSFAGGTFTISGTSSVTGTFNYTVNTTGTCTQASAAGTLIINPNATITLTSAAGTNAQTVCINTAISSITYSVAGGGTGASVTGLPAGVSGSFAGGTFTISGTPSAAGTFNYTVTTTGTCTQATATGSITVNPNAAITLTSAAGTNTQTRCINTAITTITYSISGGGTGASVTGLPAGVTGSFAGGTFTISGTPTVTGSFPYSVTTTGSCTQTSATGTLTINPNAIITLTSAAGTNAQTVCINTAITPITYSIAGGGTGASVTGLPAGVSGSFAGGTFTISGTPSVAGTFNYAVTTTGTCAQTTATGSITVNPNAVITLTSAAGTNAQSVCINTPITTITYSITGGGTGATVTGLPPGVTGSFAGGTFTISGTPTTANTFNYTVTTTGSCTPATANGSIVVNPLPVITSTPFTNETSCGANDGTITINVTGTGLTYSINGGASYVAVNNFTGLAAGPYNIMVQNGAGCSTSGGTVSISSAGAPPTPTANANPNPLCAGGTLTLSVSTPVAGETYNWSGPNYTALGATVTIPNVTNAMSGVYTVTASIGSCVSAGSSVSVTINPDAAITLTSAAGTNTQTVCNNTPITNITYSITGGGTGATVTGLPSGVTGSFAGGIFTIGGTPTATGTFNYTVNTTGTCTQTSATGTITINPDAAIALTSAAGTNTQTVCNNSSITNITYSITGGGTGATITGLPSGVTGSFAGGIFTISGTPTATGTFNYTVNTTGTCTQTSATGTITINPDAAIALTSAAGTNTQTVCNNTPITNITYSITSGGTGATVTGLPSGVTGSFAGGIFTISGTPTATGTFNYTVNTTGTCTQTSATGTITVNPDAAIALTSTAGTNLQTVCNNTPITNITYSITGGGAGATVTGLPSGVTGSFAAGTFTISGTPTATGAFTYTVNTTGTCTQTSATGTITVNPDAAIALTSAAGTNTQTVCNNTPITNITYSITGGGTGATVTGLPSGLTGSFAGGIFTISGTPTATGAFNYTVNTTGTCTQTSATGTITVNPDAAIALTSAAGTDAQNVCINTAIVNITYSISGGGTGATVTGLPAGITGSFAGGVLTISGTPFSNGTINYTVNTTGTCGQTSASGSITVSPGSSITLASAAGTDAQSVCVNSAITTITYSVTGATGATVTGLPGGVVDSYSGGILTISGTPATSGAFNYTITATGGCGQTATGSITVNPLPFITSVPFTNETSCGANDGTITINATGNGLTYSINGGSSFIAGNTFTSLSAGGYDIVVKNSFGCTVNGGTISISSAGAPAAPSANATPNPICEGGTLTLSVNSPVAGEMYSWTGPGSYSGATVTIPNVTSAMAGTYSVTASVGACVSSANTVSVVVNPNAAITLTSGTTSQTACINTPITTLTYSISGGGTGATVTGLPSGVNGTYSGGTFTISGTATTTGTFNFTINTTGTCTQTSTSGSMTINPDAAIALTSAAGTNTQTVCNNTPITNITYSITGGGTGATVTGLPSGVTGSFAGGIFTIGGTPTATGTFNYTVNTTGTCTQTSATGTITVNPDAAIALTSAAGTNTQTVCNNTPITNITYSITGGGTGATITGLPSGVTGSFAGGIFTISGTPTATGTFNYTVNTTGTCTQTSATGTITINPDAAIALTSAAGTNTQTVCNNSSITPITYSVSGGGTGATVTGLPAGITASFAGGTLTISGTPTVNGPFSYTVNTTGSCAQTSASGTITVTPGGSSAFNYTSASFCKTAPDPSPVITGSTGGTFTSSPLGLIVNSITGVINLAASTANTYTVTYAISGSCSSSSSVLVTIVNAPTASASATTPVCSGQTISLSSAGGSTYSWSGPDNFASVSQNPGITPAAAVNSGTYTVTVNNGGCTDTAQVNISVTPSPVADAGADQIITQGTSTTINGTGGSAFSWSPATGLSCTNCANPVASPSETTTYCLVTTNGACSDSDCMTLEVKTPCVTNKDLGVPNAFSPNNDGNNDEFCIQGWSECMKMFNIIIFDRWGEKVFESSETNFCWNGTFRGRTLDPAVFVYIINATFTTGESTTKKGNISIIR